ncbi:rhodanese-like domain-containing protein [Phaeodactylibacter luteus]|uniref:Rhodanese-like domain-containing protein n=1 Tax=Phaeodactylibacter luteus TaxID=1564516 RepID=A0A5C6RR73_9BACT|nr:rhodanese-like domain-containing protein [Phaeodactylibacter luteus]TXB64454.1 rhodanese-like domain-containing protein [Phaeodactylibacter luteus]
MAQDINVKELKERLDAGEEITLVDVREAYERAQFHIGGAFIPLGELHGRMDEIGAGKEDEIVVYCRSGNRSSVGKALLERAGYSQVRNLTGGMLDWVDQHGA